jgi:hypothetical protein
MILPIEYRIEIIPLETPKIQIHCHRCKKSATFYCSEKFRVNAQQKHIDVWLIYKCGQCDSTWNYPILSRIHTQALDKNLHRKFMNNDRETAWRYAFQIEQLRKVCHEVDTDIPYTLKVEAVDRKEESCKIFLFSPYLFDLRLDKILRQILGISRSKLEHMADCNSILTNPPVRLNSKLKEDLCITVLPFE